MINSVLAALKEMATVARPWGHRSWTIPLRPASVGQMTATRGCGHSVAPYRDQATREDLCLSFTLKLWTRGGRIWPGAVVIVIRLQQNRCCGLTGPFISLPPISVGFRVNYRQARH